MPLYEEHDPLARPDIFTAAFIFHLSIENQNWFILLLNHNFKTALPSQELNYSHSWKKFLRVCCSFLSQVTAAAKQWRVF